MTRLPEPDPAARAHSERVASAARAEIAASGGYIPFSRYMDFVLHAPGLGYYAAGAAKLGAAGDFVTAPEMTPLFSGALAAQVQAILAVTERREIVELGGGSGRLAADLLNALADEKYADVRIAAIGALRHWVGRRAENDQQLYQALQQKYKSSLAEIIMELLHPFSEKQKHEPETYETLIAYLNHDKLPIRELAYSHLVALVPQGVKIPYDPAGGVDNRDYSYQEWKKLIPQGKLPPSMAQPATSGAGARGPGSRRQ